MTEYQLKRYPTIAKQWTGDNRAEITAWFATWLDEDMGPYFSRDEDPEDRYDTIKFYSGDDDEEADPGAWIVVTSVPEGRRVDIMNRWSFQHLYEAAPDSPEAVAEEVKRLTAEIDRLTKALDNCRDRPWLAERWA